ncbi:hypothetical protein RI367_003568 [Sorochytrium milnesiophthora]
MSFTDPTIIANRFTTATMEERKVELQKFILRKQREVNDMQEELKVHQDELQSLIEQLAVIQQAEITERWLTEDLDDLDLSILDDSEGKDNVPLTMEQASEKALGQDAAAHPPQQPPAVPPKTQPIASERSDLPDIAEPENHEQEEMDSDDEAQEALAEAAHAVLEGLTGGLERLKTGWRQVQATEAMQNAREITTETLTDVKSELQRLTESDGYKKATVKTQSSIDAVRDHVSVGIKSLTTSETYQTSKQRALLALDVIGEASNRAMERLRKP